jgi:hypothetical protein
MPPGTQLKACNMGVELLGLRRGQGKDMVPMSYTQLQKFKRLLKGAMKDQDHELKAKTNNGEELRAQLVDT